MTVLIAVFLTTNTAKIQSSIIEIVVYSFSGRQPA